MRPTSADGTTDGATPDARPAPGARLPLVLASASPARLATLRAAGIEPEVLVSDVDEDAVLARASLARGHALTVPEQVAVLAEAKASAVVARRRADGPRPAGDAGDAGGSRDAGLVLGGDSLLELDGTAHGKPGTPAVARERWRAMRGRTGTLHTGHHLLDLATGRSASGVASTLVRFADVTDAEIDAYVATGEPLAVAGAFTIDGLGGAFVEGVDGDHHAVVGLSLPLLRRLVRDLGHDYPSLWT